MSLSREQVNHDRINLGRLVKRLDNVISDDWTPGGDQNGEAWVKAQGMAQKIKYARQLLLNVDYYQELDPQTSAPTPSQQHFLQNMRQTLDKLDSMVDAVNQRLAPELDIESSYLKLIPLPPAVEVHAQEPQVTEPSPEAELIPSDAGSLDQRSSSSVPNPTKDLLPSSSALSSPEKARASSIQPSQATSSLLSSSLQTHEELSNELARMATQLKRNAVHFSESLDKDKSLVQSASEALEKNYDAMTTSQVRLKEHRGKSWSTTWLVYGGLIAVSIAWVFMFFIIRFT